MPTSKVFLHIGAPKSGTTWLQTQLALHRSTLAESGVLYPGTSTDHFHEVLDILGRSWMGTSARPNAWRSLLTVAKAWRGTVVISHELLSWASSAADAQHCIESLAPSEVEIVYTLRDLGRLLPSAWQEDVKNGCVLDFNEWLESLRDPRNPPNPFARNFWAAHNPASVFSRWCVALQPSKIHVVTVPPTGAKTDLLWARFALAVGIDPVPPPLLRTQANRSMSWEETEVIRRINLRLNKSLPPRYREQLVKQQLAGGVYGRQNDKNFTRIALPPEWHDWARELGDRQRQILATSGANIIGALTDLTPVLTENEGITGPLPRNIARAAMSGLAAVIAQYASTLEHER